MVRGCGWVRRRGEGSHGKQMHRVAWARMAGTSLCAGRAPPCRTELAWALSALQFLSLAASVLTTRLPLGIGPAPGCPCTESLFEVLIPIST